MFLLCIFLHIDVSADELSIPGTATFDVRGEGLQITQTQAVPPGEIQRGVHIAGPALEPSSTIAGTFDYSYFLVLGLGVAGLVWMRRQSQSL